MATVTTSMATAASIPTQLATASEWGLLSEMSYARPRVTRSETAPQSSQSRQPRQPSPLRTRPRSALLPATHTPLSPPSEKGARPFVAYLPPAVPTQSLDAAMFHDMRPSYRNTTPARPSPLSKGVYTIYEAPITPPASPEPSIAEVIQQEQEETAKADKLSLAKKLKFLSRAPSTVSVASTSTLLPPPKLALGDKKSRSAPPSIRRRTSSNSLATTASARHAEPQEAKWMTEVGAPTFSRYQMCPGVVMPTPATATSARRVPPREPSKAAPAQVEQETVSRKGKEVVRVVVAAGAKPVASLAVHLPLPAVHVELKRKSSFFCFGSKHTAVSA